MADFRTKVRAKFSRHSPARSLVSQLTLDELQSQLELAPEPGLEHVSAPTPEPRRWHTWSLRSRAARHPRRSPLSSSTMEPQQQQLRQEEEGAEGVMAEASNLVSAFLGASVAAGEPALVGPNPGEGGSDRRDWNSTDDQDDDNYNRDRNHNHRHHLLLHHHGQTSGTQRRTGPEGKGKEREAEDHQQPPTTNCPPSVHDPDPNCDRGTRAVLEEHEAKEQLHSEEDSTTPLPLSSYHSSSSNNHPKPPGPTRKQSLLPQQETALIRSLLASGELTSPVGESSANYIAYNDPIVRPSMVGRKIWVKRPGASPTLVTVLEEHLVDDVRDMILKKYANTLGGIFDSPDVTLRVVPRENRQERALGPEEPICQVLDGYFPGGQTVDEALIIDVPLRRTPRPSPQPVPRYYLEEERRPQEAASEYFPPMPVATVPSPHLPAAHSMSVLTTGHVPTLPSPGAGRRSHHRDRPRLGRQHTTAPAVISGQPPMPAQHSDKSVSSAVPAAPPLPSPPTPQQNGPSQIPQAVPPPRISSPRPAARPKKNKKTNSDLPSFPSGMLNGAVPPINVLIVEDNIINLKLLEAFMRRLKVRYQNAMNGREAVTKWRAGGFHLVLMDIQLPIMNGLDATKEIRRLERLNSIGVFTSSAGSSAPPETSTSEPEGNDKLDNANLFKSPVIIVALTASSLQSDRHEALAAGCNDFLTKPVNFVWLERKVMEWGCMQALIDFDGWRQWKDFSQDGGREDDSKDSKVKGSAGSGGSGGKKKKHRPSAGSSPSASNSQMLTKELGEPVGLGVDNGL